MDQSVLIQMAFSLHNNKGAYALLLGSGVSRAAGIPTGWEITVDLIRQIAGLHGESADPNPEQWYVKKFGRPPGYSDLLDQLGKTPTERNGFIKPFIEPTEEERSEGKKQPTAAHRAIARLVATGVIKVIVTTNFDRLIERAIEDEGVVPTVISSADAAVGATPMIHSACTIIKLNGDYLDTRSKNTAIELLEYDEKIVQLLNRIFDEFGLIICGWSGDWDAGLCSIIEQIKGRRYSCYWATKSTLSEKAKVLADLRAATLLQIENANSFFSALEEKISAVAELRRPHPLSPELAVISLKKYLAESKYRIKLNDLVMDEVKRVCENISEARFPMSVSPPPTTELFEKRVYQYADELETLIPMAVHGCWWGTQESDEIWVRTIERLANCVPEGGGFDSLRALRLFPAAFVLYAAGISGMSVKRFDLVSKLLRDPKIALTNSYGMPLDNLCLQNVGSAEYFPETPQRTRRRTPLNDIVFEKLRAYFSDFLPGPKEFEESFDKFEYLLALVYGQQNHVIRSHGGKDFVWVPPGRFSWKRRINDHVGNQLQVEIEQAKNDWRPLKQGLFTGDHKSILATKVLVDQFVSSLHWSW